MRRALALAVILAGCSAPTTPTPAPTVAPTPTVSPEPTDPVTAHIETSVGELMTLSSQEDIRAWVNAESDWTDTQAVTPILRPYVLAIVGALADIALDPDKDLRVTALEVYDAASAIPGVDLP